MKRKIKLLCIGLSFALAITACGISKGNEKEDTKSEKETENKIDEKKQKELEEYYDLLVEFVEDNFVCDGKDEYNPDYKYILNDSSIVEGECEFDNDYSYFYGYQLADLNGDDKPELLLGFNSEVYNYEVIAYEDDGEIKLSKSFEIDNQGGSILPEYADAAMIYKAKKGKEKKIIISGSSGSGAGNAMFVKELNENFETNGIFGLMEDDYSSNYTVDQETTDKDDFYEKLNEFLDSYELEEAYRFLNMTDDFASTLEAVLKGQDEEAVEDEEWKTAFANKLMEIHQNDNSTGSETYKFTLRDINKDGVPELLVAHGSYHASTVNISTFYMGKVVELGSLGSMADVAFSADGVIDSSYFGGGTGYSSYYKIEKGTAIKVLNLYQTENMEAFIANNYEGDITYKYQINGRSVTESEYNAKQSEINASDFEEVYMPDAGVEITKDNIEQVFNDFTSNGASTSKEKNSSNGSGDKNSGSSTGNESAGNSSQSHAESATTPPTQTPVYNGSNKLTISSAESSSTLSDQQGNNYVASNVFDGNSSTAWAEGSSSNGVNEYIKVNLNSKQVVTMVALINGYAKSDDLYKKNCRLKKAELSFSDGSTQTVNFADSTSSIQKVSITPVETDYVKVTVKEVYDGNNYSDLCISEIELYQ